MAIYQVEPIVGGNNETWGDPELSQNRVGIGLNQCKLYNDSGVLKISPGRFGVDTGSSYGVVTVSTAESISLAGVSNGIWATITASIAGSVVSFIATTITGATNADNIPTEFTGAYNPSRGGYYSGAFRILGIVWKTAGGALGSVINVNNGVEGYQGKTGNSQPVLNLNGLDFMLPIGAILPWHKSLTGSAGLPGNWVECNGQVLSDSDSPYNGETIPDLNGDERFLRGGATSGTEQQDEFQGHGIRGRVAEGANFGNSGQRRTTNVTIGYATTTIDPAAVEIVEDTVNGYGPPRVGAETRPINMSVVFIIKIK